MINFTEYIDFFRYLNLLLGGHTDRFTGYIGFFDFSTSYWQVKMIDSTEYIVFYRLFDFSTSWWEVKLIDFTEYIGCF